MKIKIFRRLPQIPNTFVVTEEYRYVSQVLRLTEWNEVVWMGRLFARDQDFGEHWFDNWEMREAVENEAKKSGYDYSHLLIIDPSRFTQIDGDGPCHNDETKTRFWCDVCDSLEVELETLICAAKDRQSINPKWFGETEGDAKIEKAVEFLRKNWRNMQPLIAQFYSLREALMTLTDPESSPRPWFIEYGKPLLPLMFREIAQDQDEEEAIKRPAWEEIIQEILGAAPEVPETSTAQEVARIYVEWGIQLGYVV